MRPIVRSCCILMFLVGRAWFFSSRDTAQKQSSLTGHSPYTVPVHAQGAEAPTAQILGLGVYATENSPSFHVRANEIVCWQGMSADNEACVTLLLLGAKAHALLVSTRSTRLEASLLSRLTIVSLPVLKVQDTSAPTQATYEFLLDIRLGLTQLSCECQVRCD